MKKIKIYAVLVNAITTSEVKKFEVHTALLDEHGRVSQNVYQRIWNKVEKMATVAGYRFGLAPKNHYWTLMTEDGRKPTGCHYGAYVRFK